MSAATSIVVKEKSKESSRNMRSWGRQIKIRKQLKSLNRQEKRRTGVAVILMTPKITSVGRFQ